MHIALDDGYMANGNGVGLVESVVAIFSNEDGLAFMLERSESNR